VDLQPRRSPTSSSSSSRNTSPPLLTVLSRHQGKCIPSATGPTSAQTLVDHIERQLLPRVTPFLNRLISSHRERELDRHLRDEQDRAFQMAAQRDKERIEAKMAAEKAIIDAKKLAEEESRLASQRRAREAEMARVKENERMDWRRWTRRAVVSSRPTIDKNTPPSQGCSLLRIAIRLPTGGRVIHQFSQSSTLTSLYASVDSELIPNHYSASDDPVSLPDQRGVGEQALEDHVIGKGGGEEYWGFDVMLAYPRMKIPWKAGIKLSDIDQLKGGGQVVVETISDRPRDRRELAKEVGNTDEDDGYHTEDSE
jgi:FAS-associated factor 2